MSDVIRDKDQTPAESYAITGEQAWRAAIQVFRWEGAGTIEEHRDEHMMLTTWSPPAYSYSSADSFFVGAWIEPADGGMTSVRFVVSGSRLRGYVIGNSRFRLRFRQAAALLSSGKPLPVEAPPEPAPDSKLAACGAQSECDAGGGICIEGYCRR